MMRHSSLIEEIIKKAYCKKTKKPSKKTASGKYTEAAVINTVQDHSMYLISLRSS
ncbi:Uncharacterised protein [Myroides odoratus]|nr:hypothetical protein Myrod_3200 [Myroides odoratus DSM 2801]EKB05132.1 hypothetical protein HMPREF9716_02893 [Myroides odoratus CIP 103059]STZ31295.1 Uncharacterised protein [Myroides odoratus]